MLILVAVTVSYGIKSGLLSKAKTAGTDYDKEQERETLAEAVAFAYDETNDSIDRTVLEAELNKSGATWSVKENGSVYKVTSPKGNVFDVDRKENIPTTLAQYLLGEDYSGRPVMGGIIGLNEAKTKYIYTNGLNGFDASKVTFPGGMPYAFETDISEAILYCNYEQKTYKYLTKETSDGMNTTKFSTNSTIELAYEADTNSKVGKTVKCKLYNNDDLEEWIVLYDDTTYGLQIISANAIGSYYDSTNGMDLGYDNPYLDPTNNTNDSNEEKLQGAIDSYNKAIESLNAACDKTITNRTFVETVRCVGSNPKQSDSQSGGYSSNLLASLPTDESLKGKYNNGKGLAGDTNALTDYDRMVALEITASKNGKAYWLASRYVKDSTENQKVDFCVREVDETGMAGEESIWDVLASGASTSTSNVGKWNCIRPVVTLDTTKCKLVDQGDYYTIEPK